MLKIEDLQCRIGIKNILRSCSMSVAPGEVVCLLGRNGAGKSSILKSIIGIYPTKGGRIIFNDVDITTASVHRRVMAGIAYAPEDSRLFPDLTVEENIQLGFWICEKKGGAMSLDRLLQIFPHIRSMIRRKADTLSGGEKKMVSISRALALSPALILLDESFEGLSPVVVNMFSEAVNSIKKELGVSVLLAESHLHNASQVAERSYVVDRGEIIFEGRSSEILRNEQMLRLVGR